MEQRTDDWFSARLGILTGTTFKDCLSKGEVRKTLILTKVAEILTQEWTEISGAALTWGTENESHARLAYEFATGHTVSEAGMIFREDSPWIAISPDGLVGDDGGVEIKCPYTSREHARHMLYGLPAGYKAQVQGALWVTGRDWWDFVSYDPRMPPAYQLYIDRITPDQKYIGDLSDAVISAANEIADKLERLQGDS